MRQGFRADDTNVPEFCNVVRLERGDAVMLWPRVCGELLLDCLVTTAAIVERTFGVR